MSIRCIIAAVCTVTVVVLSWSPVAASDPTQVFSLRPLSSHGCVAVKFTLEPGDALSGVTWFHNDGTVPFPRLLLIEAGEVDVPDLSQTGMILRDLTGDELGWGEVILDVPVTSSTNAIFAVFVYPDTTPTTALGDGGGPGIGLAEEGGGYAFMMSPDGIQWVRHDGAKHLAIEPILMPLAARGAVPAVELASLAEATVYSVQGEISGETPQPVIRRTALHAPSPNPFNPRTTIRFELARPERVSIHVYDVRGRRVKTLVDGSLSQGRQSVIWEGDDHRGKSVASGVYFVRMDVAGDQYSQRMTLVR